MPAMNEPYFSKMFGRSPIARIMEHMKVCHDCAGLLKPYFEALIDGDWSRAEACAREIQELERQADELKREIRLNLPRTLFLPVSREDLLKLLQSQDKIANVARDIAGVTLGRKMQFPANLHHSLNKFLDASLLAVSAASESVVEFEEVMHAGFAREYSELLENIIERLDAAEHASDDIQIEIRRALFAQESELNPVDVMFTYRVFDLIGNVADNAQAVGDRLMTLIAR